jgi:hypothetical protein
MPCVEALKFLSNYVTDLQKGSIGRLVGVVRTVRTPFFGLTTYVSSGRLSHSNRAIEF